MHVFDQVDPLSLESREHSLWLLALSILFLFAVGIGLLMYPAVFSNPMALMAGSPRATFFGFCAMSVLAIIYLFNREIVISRLRQKTAKE